MEQQFPPLALPEPELKLARQKGRVHIYDPIRKKYLLLSPEEWVRQHWLSYFLHQAQFPASSIAVEAGLKVLGQQRRSDILIHRQGQPALLVEVKAPSVKINQAVFDQAARYNRVYGVALLLLSNGLQHYYARVDHAQERYHFIAHLPQPEDLESKTA